MPCLVLAAALLALLEFPSLSAAQNIESTLQEAERRAWLTDWAAATPLYAEAEKLARASGDRRNALFARFGRLRGQMQTLPLQRISDEIAADLDSALATNDKRLRLRGLTAKGDIDLEWDIRAAERDWLRVRDVARELRDAGWENRAAGELGMIAFLKGNTGDATKAVQGAYDTATKSGDVGGQLRYLSSIANGILLAGYAPIALGFVDRALKLSQEHPETGFPFVAYSTKVLTLLEMKQVDEAERFAQEAITQARSGDRRIKEIELSMMLARIAQMRSQPERWIEHLQRARATAVEGGVLRLLADVEAGLAEAFRARDDVATARRHATAAVDLTASTGGRFLLPLRLGVLAGLDVEQGRLAQADRLYDRAADIVEGIMVNVPSRTAQARLVGVMADLYAGHFRLAAGGLRDPYKAFRIAERVRGRAIADVLRTMPTAAAGARDDARLREVAAQQLRLMRARTPTERQRVLDTLWEAEQRTTVPMIRLPLPAAPPGRNGNGGLRALQRVLSPNEVVLEYVLLESSSYCFVITAQTLRLVELAGRPQVERQASAFHDDVRLGRAGVAESGRTLSETILTPLGIDLQTTRRVVVVPDGKLHLVPFDTMASLMHSTAPPFVIAPSAGVLALLRQGRTTQPSQPLLAVGGVPYEKVTSAKGMAAISESGPSGFFDAAIPPQLPTLPLALAEVRTVAELVGARSVVLAGDAATESAFKRQELSQFEVLHVAAHGFADPKFPERAAILLLSDPGAVEDGLLQPREIARLRLNARLVALSVCDTAVGPTLGQEGVLNLARAFILAGAGAVMTTLWTVSDATSAALMRRFYERLVEGDDVAEALRKSKRDVLETYGPKAGPSLAAFQIVGDGSQRLRLAGRTAATQGASQQP